MRFAAILTFIFVIAKIIGCLWWPWIYVFSPIIIMTVIYALITLIALGIAIFAAAKS